jgi:hypothetical protein
LEWKLLNLSYLLQPFSEENKINFFKKWGLKDGFTVGGNKVNKKGASHKFNPSSLPWSIVDSYPGRW